MNKVRDACSLVYKATNVHVGPAADPEYRLLLSRYRADSEFAAYVGEAATGFQLVLLDVSERGIVIAPLNKDSRFALRLSDLRRSFQKTLTDEHKVALVIAIFTISAVFYPTSDFLEEGGSIAFPATLGQMRDKLIRVVDDLSKPKEGADCATAVLEPGWRSLTGLPPAIPDAKRASWSSIEGIIRLALNHLLDNGLVRRQEQDDLGEKNSYTPTHQFRVQLLHLTLPKLFQTITQASEEH